MKHLLAILKKMNRAATARDEMSAYISIQSRPPKALAAPSERNEKRLEATEGVPGTLRGAASGRLTRKRYIADSFQSE